MDGQTTRCCLCHATEDVVTRLEYVGGVGYLPVRQCRDLTACWDRWDTQHGIKATEVEVRAS